MADKKKKVKKVVGRRSVTRKKLAVKKKPAAKKKPIRKQLSEKTTVKKIPVKTKVIVVGKITHYFPKVRAAVIKLKIPLSIGDRIKIKGHTTDFTEDVVSMQMDRVPVKAAKKGQEIGLMVQARVRRGDTVVMA